MAENRSCAYCGTEGNLTREHVFPGFIDSRERTRTGEPMISNVRDHGKEKIVGGELTVADVCAACNNGLLSHLDNYGSALFDRYFANTVEPGELIRFEYDESA